MFPDPPGYDPCCGFTTELKLVGGPGFFPVHDGRFVNDQAAGRENVVFFGTDWGPTSVAEACRRDAMAGQLCSCQRSLRPRGEPRPTPTEGNLYEALSACSGLDLRSVVLTNAVLGLATTGQMRGNAAIYRKHPGYLRDCGAYHRRRLARLRPRLVVLISPWKKAVR